MSRRETIWTKWMGPGLSHRRSLDIEDAVRIISDEFEALRIVSDARIRALESQIDFMQREIDSLRVEVASK